MKNKIILLAFLATTSVLLSAQIPPEKAKELMGQRFISCAEAQKIYPEIPKNLSINYSENLLKNSPKAWLLPLEKNGGYYYFLIQANFEHETAKPGFLNNKDTLQLQEACMAVKIMREIRPTFFRSEEDFKFFFRTKTPGNRPEKKPLNKAVSYAAGNFIVVSWPQNPQFGIMNKDYISYLDYDASGIEKDLCFIFLPEGHAPVTPKESVYVLTLFYYK